MPFHLPEGLVEGQRHFLEIPEAEVPDRPPFAGFEPGSKDDVPLLEHSQRDGDQNVRPPEVPGLLSAFGLDPDAFLVNLDSGHPVSEADVGASGQRLDQAPVAAGRKVTESVSGVFRMVGHRQRDRARPAGEWLVLP